MAAIAITNPFTVISDDDGTPLENGYVNIGTVNLDPISNPIVVYWDQALTMPAAQPIRTINGYFSRNGSPGKLYVDAVDYSILIRNKNSVFLYASLINSNIATSIATTSLTGQLDASRIDFTQNGTGAVLTDVDAKLNANISVKDFGAVGNGTNDDTAEIQAALDSISSGVVHLPAGTYKITATIHMNTTKVTLRGDGCQTSILKAAVGFAGTEVVHMVNPSNCIIEDLQLDANSLVADGLHIDDGIGISISRLLIKNCTGIAYKIRNVDNCVLQECGSDTSAGPAFDFLASATLDAASTIDGVRCKLIDCYSSAAGTTGSIHSEQVDTSSINVIIERFKEITNTGTISVDTNDIHLNHVIQLVDCLFLDALPGEVIVAKQFDVVRTGGIVLNHSTAVPILQIASIYSSAIEYAGLVSMVIADGELSGSPTNTSLYLLVVNSGNVAVASANNSPVVDITFSLNRTTEQIEAIATSPVSGTFYFYANALGPIKISNI
jgi:hypothetical protein